ncbi:unnamed protein product [Mytilus edulis]|uniref:Uncharacterized protein n=1 Tax=Mytilus edulis TaxID=6550 RepID=A0A8S3Q4I0_MYTED|nr:unnamed protein product [Mytilus edulis]
MERYGARRLRMTIWETTRNGQLQTTHLGSILFILIINIAPSDLHAADAIYHQTCSVNFRTGKQIPVSKQANKEVKRTTPGRPKEDSSEKAFLQIVRQLEETQDELASVSDLVQAMEDICGDKAYSVVHMKKRLQTYFGSDIIITEVNGKPNIVTFRRTASSILNEFYRGPPT